MSNLAEACKTHGIIAGDIIEIANPRNSLTDAINSAIGNNDKPIMEGSLIEITAIGETAILGFWMVGEYKPNKTTDNYGDIEWNRCPTMRHESKFSSATIMRKVGYKDLHGKYIFTLPELKNVYARCLDEQDV